MGKQERKLLKVLLKQGARGGVRRIKYVAQKGPVEKQLERTSNGKSKEKTSGNEEGRESCQEVKMKRGKFEPWKEISFTR